MDRTTSAGEPYPLGASVMGEGVNFAVTAGQAVE